jgi:tetratricopeptide (TPR) repeat protein
MESEEKQEKFKDMLSKNLTELKAEFEKNPTMDTLIQIVVTYHKLGQTERGLGFADAILMQLPDGKDKWFHKGLIMGSVERDEEALSYLDRALECEPEDTQTLHSKSMMLNKLGRFEEAIVVCDRSLEVNPTDLQALSNKLVSLFGSKHHDDAFKLYQRSITIKAEGVYAWHCKGMIDGLMGEYLIETRFEDNDRLSKKKVADSLNLIDSIIDNFGIHVKTWYELGKHSGKETYHRVTARKS